MSAYTPFSIHISHYSLSDTSFVGSDSKELTAKPTPIVRTDNTKSASQNMGEERERGERKEERERAEMENR